MWPIGLGGAMLVFQNFVIDHMMGNSTFILMHCSFKSNPGHLIYIYIVGNSVPKPIVSLLTVVLIFVFVHEL